MNPRTVLQERYPQADFWEYFRFLGECKGTMPSGRTHEHHICPKKQFPEYRYEPENLITLKIEDHAFAHKLLGAAVPELSTPDAWIKTSLLAASKSGALHKERGTGIFGRALEKKSADVCNGGRISGRKNRELGRGIFGRSTKKMTEDGRKAGQISTHTRWHLKRCIVNPTCELCHV